MKIDFALGLCLGGVLTFYFSVLILGFYYDTVMKEGAEEARKLYEKNLNKLKRKIKRLERENEKK